jgi:hypothetical protein
MNLAHIFIEKNEMGHPLSKSIIEKEVLSKSCGLLGGSKNACATAISFNVTIWFYLCFRFITCRRVEFRVANVPCCFLSVSGVSFRPQV